MVYDVGRVDGKKKTISSLMRIYPESNCTELIKITMVMTLSMAGWLVGWLVGVV